jgi:hypothetical protein
MLDVVATIPSSPFEACVLVIVAMDSSLALRISLLFQHSLLYAIHRRVSNLLDGTERLSLNLF